MYQAYDDLFFEDRNSYNQKLSLVKNNSNNAELNSAIQFFCNIPNSKANNIPKTDKETITMPEENLININELGSNSENQKDN